MAAERGLSDKSNARAKIQPSCQRRIFPDRDPFLRSFPSASEARSRRRGAVHLGAVPRPPSGSRRWSGGSPPTRRRPAPSPGGDPAAVGEPEGAGGGAGGGAGLLTAGPAGSVDSVPLPPAKRGTRCDGGCTGRPPSRKRGRGWECPEEREKGAGTEAPPGAPMAFQCSTNLGVPGGSGARSRTRTGTPCNGQRGLSSPCLRSTIRARMWAPLQGRSLSAARVATFARWPDLV